jgi:S1-C subfamily serine protease/HEAT repeat protein
MSHHPGRPARRFVSVAVSLLAASAVACGPGATSPTTASVPASAPLAPAPPDRREPAVARAPTTAEIVARCEPSVALIRGKNGSGTGFLVRPGLLVTNAHVLEGEIVQDLEVRFPSAPRGERGPLSADLVYEDSLRDLAVLSVATRLPPIELADAYTFRKGDDVLTIGNPGAPGDAVLENAVSRGVLSTQAEIDGRAFHQLGMSVNPGNSGGPVLDPQGRVIGVVTLRLANAEAVAFCVPLADLRGAVEAAAARAAERPGGRPAGPAVPALAYRWEPGATLVYSVRLDLDLGRRVRTIEGASLYKVQSAGGDAIALKHRGWLSTRVRDEGDDSAPGPGPANPVEGTVEIDPRGRVLKSAGSTPVAILGDLSLLLLEPLPDRPRASWDVAQAVALQHTEVREAPDPGLPLGLPGLRYDRGWPGVGVGIAGGVSPFPPRIGPGRGVFPGFGGRLPAPPRRDVQVTTWPAQEQASYVVGPRNDDGTYPIAKSYRLRTQEQTAEGEPRLLMTGSGTLTFDPARGALVAVTLKGRMVQSTETVTVRTPLTLTCRLLEGAERDRALVAPTLPATPNRPLDAKGVDAALADLASGDDGRRQGAARTLADAAPVAARRPAVAAALLACLDPPDPGLRAAAVRALGVWGDASARAPLIERLEAPDFGARAELAEALARLGPDERSAVALAALLAKDSHAAGNALRAMGPTAEAPLLVIVEAPTPVGGDPRPRIEAARVLGAVGTTKAVDRLGAVAARRQAGRLGQVAAAALRSIEERHPGAEALAMLLDDLDDGDAGRRREAVERLAKAAPADAMRDRAVRAFAANLDEPDDHLAVWSARGLASWGGPDARNELARAVADPRFRPWREALDALAAIGPGPGAIDALLARLGEDPARVVRALAAVGPAAEPALQSLLSHKDGGVRQEACRVLVEVGTGASLAPLESVAGRDENVFVRQGAAAAVAALKARLDGGPEVDRLIATLRNGDRRRQDEAMRRLAEVQPDDARRAEVSRALDPLLTPDVFRIEAAAKAAARWADDRARRRLVGLMTDPDFRPWGHVARAIAANRPDDAAIGALVGRYKDDRGLVGEALKPLGPRAEGPLLGLVVDASVPFDARIGAAQLLAEIGTSASLDPLRGLAAQAGDEPVAATAADAIRAIEARW